MSACKTLARATGLRTGVWHGDAALELELPSDWDTTTLWPRTPPALRPGQIAESLERPVQQPPIRELCRGARKPLVIVDDINRPTPVASILPHVFRHFREAGIDPRNATILLATGTHGQPGADTVASKVGAEAMSTCEVVVHSAIGGTAYAGKTRSGTPVHVNRRVLGSDLVLGIGGIYPNDTAGWGGGSKLALGVLGFRSIRRMHYSHSSAGWGARPKRSSFRDELDEIARMIRLASVISVHVNAQREPVRICSGDYLSYYSNEVDFARKTFSVAPPGEADVVISNAYPCDVTLTFARMKGAAPLRRCAPSSSRILLASCSRGAGHHGLFPVVNVSGYHRLRGYLRMAAALTPAEFASRAFSAIGRRLERPHGGGRAAPVSAPRNPIWLYAGALPDALQVRMPGVRITTSWEEILTAVRREQEGKGRLKTVVYPCAPLLSFE